MRNIKTKYYVGRRYNDPVRTNSSKDANHAVAQAVLHMQVGHYTDIDGNPATACEVFDSESGMLHAVVSRSPLGQITINYKRDPRAYEVRLAYGAFADVLKGIK